MSAFECVTLAVSVIAIVLAAIAYFRMSRVINQLGRRGQTWFDHAEDAELGQRPSEDDRDDPIPRRPLRGRRIRGGRGPDWSRRPGWPEAAPVARGCIS